MDAWLTHIPKAATEVGPGVAFSFSRCEGGDDHEHSKDCIWIWHYCTQKLSATSVAPDSDFGWRPGGIEAHTLERIDPITISPSLYWPECCGKHGFLQMGRYYDI